MKNDRLIPGRGIWMFGVPIFLILLVGYIYLRSVNRSIELELAQTMQKNDVLEGEVYRLRQLNNQKEAKLSYLQDARLMRFLGWKDDSNYIWLYHRSADSTWFAEVHAIEAIPDFHVYHLIIDGKYLGSFEKIFDAEGLPKIGEGLLGEKAEIYFGPEGDYSELAPSQKLYEIDLRKQFPERSF